MTARVTAFVHSLFDEVYRCRVLLYAWGGVRSPVSFRLVAKRITVVQVPAHSIVFLRVFWGLVMASEIWTYIEHDYEKTLMQLVEPKFLFHYYGFDW